MERLPPPAEQPNIAEQVDQYLRKYNDATTWLAETLDGSMRTPFEYTFDGQELYASDGSKMGKVFDDSIENAAALAARTPELSFEKRRRLLEKEEYHDMLGMASGTQANTMVVVSDYPPELMHSNRSVGGYNGARKQTMLRVLTWRNGRMQMYSQSLDRSDRQALEAIYTNFGQMPQPGELLGQRIHANLSAEDQQYLVDRLMGVYDRALSAQYGGTWHAGRKEELHDTYQFVLSQQQLVDRLVMQDLNGALTDTERYNIAALLAERFEQFKRPDIVVEHAAVVFGAVYDLNMQLHRAGERARMEGKQFDGCGLSVGSESSSSAYSQLAEAGYGNQSVEDKFGSLEFKCPKGHMNQRPYGKLIDNCKVCKVSVRC